MIQSQATRLYELLKDGRPVKRVSPKRRGIKEIRTCGVCSCLFEVLLSDAKRRPNGGKHCSRECSNIGAPRGVALSEQAWNKGMKLGDHPAIEKYASKLRGSGNPRWGNAGTRRGVKVSLETRLKQSRARKGVFVGEKNPNWKGGVTKENTAQRTSWKARVWKRVVLSRFGYTCANCGSKENIHAHHVFTFANNRDFRFSPANGVCLCKTCHYQLHNDWCQDRKRGRFQQVLQLENRFFLIEKWADSENRGMYYTRMLGEVKKPDKKLLIKGGSFIR